MALEQKLSLKLSQKLVMTPSLQQAIKLLQMTRLELEGVLNQELVENPVLEDTQLESSEEETDTVDEVAEDEKNDDFESMSDVDLDAYFNDYLGVNENTTSSSYEHKEALPPLENTLSREPDLYDHLLLEVRMSDLSPLRREIAELIVGNLDEDGFLVATVEEIQLLGASEEEAARYRSLRSAWEARRQAEEEAGDEEERSASQEATTPAPAEAQESGGAASGPDAQAHHLPTEPPEIPGYPRLEVEAALDFVRSLDPPGVGYATLRESLLAQLEVEGVEPDELCYRLVDEEWEALLKRQIPAIAKRFGVAVKELEEPVHRIQALETRPGRRYSTQRAQYVEPDVTVVKMGGDYVIQLNDDGLPRLRVSRAYRRMLAQMRRDRDEDKDDARQYIKDKMRSAMWLIKSLDQRQRTIHKVATSIVKQQQDFLEKGIEHLRPMVLRDVADDIEMHESTVSRVVSNKYIHTPRGLFPMKFFFHSGIDRDYGEDISSLTVKRKIENLIEDEDPKRPMSDSEIMRMLRREGIKIARRTVAKYRDELGIPSSTDRKQIF